MDETLAAERRVRVGEYHLLEELGRGGMGVVYRARNSSGEVVALKLLLDESIDRTGERLAREANARIEHPNVIRVLDAGNHAGTAYIVFEHLEGETLAEKLDQGRLSAETTCALGVQLCAGLGAIHEAGFVHRDIKPANIFLCDDGTLKILDFGVALNRGSDTDRLTRQGMVLGTPAYLAPEQARGELSIGPPADIWAAGMVLYQCLSGSLPFKRETPLASLVAGILEDVPPLESVVAEIPQALAYAIEKALEKQSQDRWTSANEMCTALRHSDLAPGETTEIGPSPRRTTEAENRVVAVVLAEALVDARAMKEISERWGAFYTPLAGQRALAVFGYETWEGDELGRAAAAALEAHGVARKLALCVRFGTRGDDGISGEVLDEAQRSLRQISSGIVVDAETGENLRDAYLLRRLDSGHLELVKVRSVRSDQVGVLTVGRADELSRLEQEFDRVRRERCPRLAILRGPAGIGRSHLLRCLRGNLAQENALVLSARCESHQRQLGLSTLAAAIRARAQQGASDAGWPSLLGQGELPSRALDCLARDAWGDASNKKVSTIFLAALLGVRTDLSSQELAAAMADPMLMADNLKLAVLDYLEGHLKQRTVVLLIDDAHLADRHSLEVLRSLLRHDGGSLLVVLAGRSDRSIDLRVSRGRGIEIELEALGRDETYQFARSMVDFELSPAIQDLLAKNTRGNPLFIRQTVLALSSSPREGRLPDDLPLPISLEAAAQSRLDQLPATEKDLCKRTALLGSSFTEAEALQLCEEASPEEIRELLRKELIRECDSFASTGHYRIDSPILSMVAARMLADDQRAETHQRAADILSCRDPVPLASVARHFEAASRHRQAGFYYAQAAIQAASRGSSEMVIECARKALELGVPPEQAFDLHMAHANALRFAGERGQHGEALDAARACAQSARDVSISNIEKARWLDRGGDWEGARASFASGILQARSSGRDEDLAFALAWYSQSLAYRGLLDEARAALREARELQVAGEHQALLADSQAQLAAVDGDLEQRLRAFRDAAEQYKKVGDVRRAAGAEVNLADAYNRLGAYPQAVTALRDGLEQCRRVGHNLMEGYALANLGYALTHLDRLPEATAALEEAAELALATDDHRLGAAVELYRARASFMEEAVGDSVRLANRAVRSAQRLQMSSIEALALALVSRITLKSGDRRAALAHASRAHAIRNALGSMEEDEAEIDIAYVTCLRSVGREQEAQGILAAAIERVEKQAKSIEHEGFRSSFRRGVRSHSTLFQL